MTDGDDADVKEVVGAHWNGRAATFDDEPQHGIHSDAQRERWLSLLREWAGDAPLCVLDVGCGTGFLSLLLSSLGHDVTGVDAAPEMLERARTKAGDAGHDVAFHRGDAERLPIAADAFDLVVARHLVWTLPDPAAALAEWQRVVEPGGRILVVEGYWDHDEPWEEYTEVHGDLPCYDGRRADELAAFVADAGLEAIEHEPLQDPVLWGREPRHEYYAMAGEVPGADTA